jgi:hypothetical protein
MQMGSLWVPGGEYDKKVLIFFYLRDIFRHGLMMIGARCVILHTWRRFKIGLLCLLQKQSRDAGWTRIQG